MVVSYKTMQKHRKLDEFTNSTEEAKEEAEDEEE